MSKEKPFIGPRNANPLERELYNLKFFPDDVMITSALSLTIAFLAKKSLNIDTIPIDNFRKIVTSFILITIAGRIAYNTKEKREK